MDNEYNLIDFLQQLQRWKKELVISTAVIIILSAAGSLMLPNYYKAETIFYAASPDLAKPIPIGGEEKDVRIYGDDKDLDRLFTIAVSHDILFHLIDSFDLYDHYDIDKNGEKAKFEVREQLLENYQTIKTKYGALQLIVEDKDPEIAAAIANAARNKLEQLSQKIVKDSQAKLIENYNQSLVKKQILSDSLARKMRAIKGSSDIFETWTQSGIYTNLLADVTSELEDAKGKIVFYKKYPTLKDSLIKYMAREAGALNKVAKAKSELEKYVPVLSELKQLDQEVSRLNDQISLDKERLKQLYATYSVPFTALHLVEEADVPVQKSRPKRLIIVLLTSLCGIMLSFIAVFVLDSMQNLKHHKLD
jgi:tyrosine-protein kinase Etk/Wzc